jgi:hypothetical protein
MLGSGPGYSFSRFLNPQLSETGSEIGRSQRRSSLCLQFCPCSSNTNRTGFLCRDSKNRVERLTVHGIDVFPIGGGVEQERSKQLGTLQITALKIQRASGALRGGQGNLAWPCADAYASRCCGMAVYMLSAMWIAWQVCLRTFSPWLFGNRASGEQECLCRSRRQPPT